MKKYDIKVNGTTYQVEVEETGAGGSSVPRAAAPAASSAPAETPAPPPTAGAAKEGSDESKAPSTAPSDGTTTISAPMPGTVLEIMVSEGQSVKSGDALLILEAMKMGNEIIAPKDGTVDVIMARKSDLVNAGDPLLSLK